jgi:DNA-binding NarL/FixJ family response regulator
MCANCRPFDLPGPGAPDARALIPAAGRRKLRAVPATVRIVLVEDNQMFRETLELLLGFRGDLEIVGSVGTGQRAVEVCAAVKPDVAVIDYRMPGLSGAQTTEGVRRVSPDTRVVCLTASVSRAEVAELYAAGAVACVNKAEELEQIVAAIHAAASDLSPAEWS